MLRRFPRQALPALSLSVLLAACGGGDSDSTNTAASTAPSVAVGTPGFIAPQSTGDTATDGFNWFNYRRQIVGLQPFTRNSQVDAAAKNHSNYQAVNDTITHDEEFGKQGFTGSAPATRLMSAGYRFAPSAAYGEVISSTSSSSGFSAAEDLVTAIYHRFVIFDPVFREAGAGSARSSRGSTYFTSDFVAAGFNGGLGRGNIVSYPAAGQQEVPLNFFSDNELPDPVPSANEVGYPISVHADITSILKVKSFTVQPHGAAPLQVQSLTHDNDPETPESAAAIIPIAILKPETVYDVTFSGTVDGINVDRSWSFTTR